MIALLLAGLGASDSAPREAHAPPAPISDIRYEVTFDAAAARTRTLAVTMSFRTGGAEPVLLSLPNWTPGAYEVSDYAKRVSDFAASSDGSQLKWDKTDPDTWRVFAGANRGVRVSFTFAADTLDNAMAWARPDFLLVNGTNVFLYPEGQSLDFRATVSWKTEPDWKIATGMHAATPARSYTEGNYHDLVDMPFFIGRFDLDSSQVEGRWTRLATYPAGALSGDARRNAWRDIARAIPAEVKVFRETPWDTYTIMMIFDASFPGGSALEHQNSHVGVYTPGIIGSPILISITAHEIFHAWNVKRLRPADMWPYRYEGPQPTTLLWMSEGITDYYADLALVRGGVIDSSVFLQLTQEKIDNVSQARPVALEDASLSTWIHPADGTGYLYYPKGSLAGLMLDLVIRDATDNRRSLDDVMRELYQSAYKAGRGFTNDEFWKVAAAQAGKPLQDFYDRYVDGREPYPWAAILPLAGLRFRADTIREPRLGTQVAEDSGRIRVVAVVPGSVAEQAGVKVGDELVAVGEVKVTSPEFGVDFRTRYAKRDGESLDLVVRRDGKPTTLKAVVRVVARVEGGLGFDPAAGAKALRVRAGVLRGS